MRGESASGKFPILGALRSALPLRQGATPGDVRDRRRDACYRESKIVNAEGPLSCRLFVRERLEAELPLVPELSFVYFRRNARRGDWLWTSGIFGRIARWLRGPACMAGIGVPSDLREGWQPRMLADAEMSPRDRVAVVIAPEQDSGRGVLERAALLRSRHRIAVAGEVTRSDSLSGQHPLLHAEVTFERAPDGWLATTSVRELGRKLSHHVIEAQFPAERFALCP